MKYKISDLFEVNIVEDKQIFISNDFSVIYVADELATYIIDLFKTENTIDSVCNSLSSMEGFCLREFQEFIEKIISHKIILPCDN